MARPEVDITDLDEAFRLVFRIAQPVRRRQSVRLLKSTIEYAFDTGSTLEAKIAAIIEQLKGEFGVEARYVTRDEMVHFKPGNGVHQRPRGRA
jgi:hypothetical protein